jgi:hypothetical protein
VSRGIERGDPEEQNTHHPALKALLDLYHPVLIATRKPIRLFSTNVHGG